jgi:hypothetical protein
MEEGLDEIAGCSRGSISRGHSGESYLGREPFKGVSNAFGSGAGNPYAVAAVMVEGRTKVETGDGMRGPGVAVGWFFMDEDTCARRGQGRAVVVEGAMDLGIGRETGIDAGPTKEVEADECLWEKTIPEMEGKVRVRAAKASNEVIFERANCAFGSIAAVDARWGKLVIDVLGLHVVLEGGGGFIVKLLEVGLETVRGEEGGAALVGSKDGGSGAAGHGLDVDIVAVIIVEYQQVGVAGTGGAEKAAHLVSVDVSSDGFAGGIEITGAERRRFRENGADVSR